MVTCIVLVSVVGEALGPEEALTDDALQRLGDQLAARWGTASIGREPPAIWIWEPLVEEGVISLRGLAAIIEVDLPDNEGDKAVLRRQLSDWIAASGASKTLQVHIVWASQMIKFNIERLHVGARKPKDSHDHEDQGTAGIGKD